MARVSISQARRNGIALLVGTAGFLLSSSAAAEVGRGYLQLPGVRGGARIADFADWARIEGRYWGLVPYASPIGTGPSTAQGAFSTPAAPRSGPGELVIAIAKESPALAALAAHCRDHTRLGDVRFAESADDFRDPQLELGDRPASIPSYFQYSLRDVTISACPVADGAPEQAFVLKFNDIAWLNYDSQSPKSFPGRSIGRRSMRSVEKIALQPAVLQPPPASGRTKTFVMNWFGFAHDAGKTQCPRMNAKPDPANFTVPKATEAQLQRGTNPLENRGPGGLNVCLLPGIAPDPGNVPPRTDVADGFNLDGHSKGPFPKTTCPHRNYVSKTGDPGVDNQFFTVAGCIPGLQGRQGLWQQVLNEEWHSGAVSMLFEISGIDDDRNDDSVEITILYSEDDPEKDPGGKEVLRDYTFRISDKPEYAHFFAQIPARIVDGVITTEPRRKLDLNLAKGPAIRLSDARMRLEINSNGNLVGLLGGYQNWRYIANYYNFVGYEITFGFQCPGFYNALRRAADGIKDPETGEFTGISTAYEIEAFPAFIPNSQREGSRTAAVQTAAEAPSQSGATRRR